MDRLSAVIAVAALAACGKSDPAAPPPRTNGAKVATPKAASTDAFCDVHAADDRAAVFRWPELAGGARPPAAAGGWRWVNIWATWCKPCIEEMPRLVAWRDRRAAAGQRVELTFVSVDDSDADVAEFRRDHPQAPPSLRVAGSDQRTAWLHALGVVDGAIPIHLFVSPANRLRCARGAEVREQDLAVVDRMLAE